MRHRASLVVACALVAAGWPAGAVAEAGDPAARVESVRVPFVDGRGRSGSAVAFSAATFAGSVHVMRGGELLYTLRGGESGRAFTERPVGGRGRPAGGRRSATQISSFVGGDPACWWSEAAAYETVELGELWPGITLSVAARGRSVEKVFTVAPRARPSRIRMRFDGARALRVADDGALVLETGGGEVRFSPPVAYQERGGARVPVTVRYRARGRDYGFSVGSYDRTLPLVIDPLLQSTYLGGRLSEESFALAVHPISGDVIVAGHTYSLDFPGTAGGAQPNHGPIGFTVDPYLDAFVARLDPSLTVLRQATYLGGEGADTVYDMAIHPSSGDVFVTGWTFSADFPGTLGGAQSGSGGDYDAFVARLNGALTALEGSTYLGGTIADYAYAIALDPARDAVFVAGQSFSADFPDVAGGAQSGHSGGSSDAFVVRLNTSLTTRAQATFLGGAGLDVIASLAVRPADGELFASGYTQSNNFPGAGGGAQPFHGGAYDGFVVLLAGSLTSRRQTSFIGGLANDFVEAMLLHPETGEVFVAGATNSANLPGTAGGAQPQRNGTGDAFVARFAPSLAAINQATYLGGGGDEYIAGLAFSPVTGELFVTGSTASSDFPAVAGGWQSTLRGITDVFVSRLDPALTRVNQSTYIGGSAGDLSEAIALHPGGGEVFVSGTTLSPDFPRVAGGAQSEFRELPATFDTFVARFSSDLRETPCAGGPATLCVNGGRFTVEVSWRAVHLGTSGTGRAVTLTSDTGYFWFFSPNNVELVVKVVDGRAFNGHFWVFYGALSDVEYAITVTDTQTGATKTYFNPQGRLASAADTAAFPAAATGAAPTSSASPGTAPASDFAACDAGPTTLCLNAGRFRVEVAWRAAHLGTSGRGRAQTLTSDTGYFWFFTANNVELAVKVVDGRAFNGRFWVFYGALSDVEYTVTVTDTETGAVKTYLNPQGTLASVADTAAF